MSIESDETDLFIITEEEAGERLDKVLSKRFKEMYSRTYFQYLLEEELVLLNGSPVKKRTKPQTGDEVEVQFATVPEIKLTPENIPLTVIYEDDYLLAINKPAGMVVHPAPGNWSGTVVNALLYHCDQLAIQTESLRPGIVHRLDKETSGILIAAKTLDMQQKLTALFSDRKIHKEYLAICLGTPVEGEINLPIGRHPIHRKQMAVVPTGKQALSYCKLLGTNDKLSLVQMTIATGRTHQIRVHLKYKGHPVLGDELYGLTASNNYYNIHRQLLHASKLEFDHPITGEKIELKSLPPDDFLQFARKILPKSSFNHLIEIFS